MEMFHGQSLKMSQTGKVALVTGGTRGLGRAFAEALLQNGAHGVVICDLLREGEATAKELTGKFGKKVVYLPCDVTNDEQFEDCFKRAKEEFSAIDIVINNAGIANEREPMWKKMIAVNFTGVARGTRLGLKYMSKENGGRGGIIVNIASITSLESFPSIPVYSATKAAVNQLSRSFGSDLYYLKTGVKVVAINPGLTATSMTSNPLDLVEDDKDVSDNIVKHVAMFYEQKADNMGRGLIQVLEKAQNGSLWTIENDEPAKLTIIK